jgi:hypothetical protein
VVSFWFDTPVAWYIFRRAAHVAFVLSCLEYYQINLSLFLSASTCPDSIHPRTLLGFIAYLWVFLYFCLNVGLCLHLPTPWLRLTGPTEQE